MVTKAMKKVQEKLSGFARTLNEIRTLVKGTGIQEKINKTGSSFFQGSKRFVKLVQTGKEGVYLEVNVVLPADLVKKAGSAMTSFSKVEASKKHLGTMRHLYRGNDSALVTQILKGAKAAFDQELKTEAVQAEKVEKKAKEKASGNAKKPATTGMTTRKMSKEDIARLEGYEAEGKLKTLPNINKKPTGQEIVEAVKEEVAAMKASEEPEVPAEVPAQ